MEKSRKDQLLEEMNELRNNRRDRTISGWVAACNNLLKEYNEIPNMEYCSKCQIPTAHDESCIRCEMLGRIQ